MAFAFLETKNIFAYYLQSTNLFIINKHFYEINHWIIINKIIIKKSLNTQQTVLFWD